MSRNRRRQYAVGAIVLAVLIALLIVEMARVAHASSKATYDAGLTSVRNAEMTPQNGYAMRGRTMLAEMQSGFTAIARAVEPEVVSIRIDKTVKTTEMVPSMPDALPFGSFPNFPGFGNGNGNNFQFFQQMPQTFVEQGAGSGVIVRPDGWILTNDHVVAGANRVIVTLKDGRQYPGTVRGDFRSDIAVVKIDAHNLPYATFANSRDVRVGQWAVAFGSPYTLAETMTVGVVSAKHRETEIGQGSGARFYPSLIQTDAPINPGNSGGPLCNIYGHVMGIDVAIESPSGGSVGIGFAIPSNSAENIMDQLIEHGRVTRGFLGVGPRDLTAAERRNHNLPTGGAMIAEVQGDTPASRAGLQPGDIVLRVDGKPVRDESSFRNMIAAVGPGNDARLLIRRGTQDVTITARLEEPPAIAGQGSASTAPERRKLGMSVTPLTPEIAQKFNITGIQHGLVVVGVEQGSAAADAGLQPGDVIISADHRPIETISGLRTALKAVPSGGNFVMVVKRGNAEVLVTAMVP